MNDNVTNSQEKIERNRMYRHPVLVIVAACIFIWAAGSTELIQGVILENKVFLAVLVTAGYLAYYCYCYDKGTLNKRKIITGILLGSFIIRVLFILISPYDLGQHDVHFVGGWNTNEIGSGHFGYIEFLYKFREFPNFDPTNVWAFYNPPLHHIISAVWIGINRMLGFEYELCMENLQILTLFYATVSTYLVYRILQEFKIKGNNLLILTGVLVFHPVFAVLSASLNNDCLAVLFSLSTLLHIIRWYKKQSYSRILMIALSISLGMLTKTSVGLLAPGVGIVFLMVLVRNRVQWKKIGCQLLLFGLVSIPIGMAWVVRLRVLYQIPFTYVPMLGETDQYQYVGNYGVWERLGIPVAESLVHPWNNWNPESEHHIWAELFRSALFDEKAFQMSGNLYELLAVTLLFTSVLVAVFMNVLLIRVLIQKRSMDGALKGMIVLGYAVLLISYIKFCFQYPFICTMNFRYIVVTILFPAIGTGIWVEKNKGGKRELAVKILICGFGILCVGLMLAYCLNWSATDVQTLNGNG